MDTTDSLDTASCNIWPDEHSNRTDAAIPAPFFHEQVAAAAARDPAALAIDDGTARLDYAQLDERASRLARYLVSLGAAPGERVGLLLERSAASLVCQLAIFKTGAACLLFDPGYPQARNTFMLSDAAPVVTLTRPGLAAELPAGAPVLTVDPAVDAAEAPWQAFPVTGPWAAVTADTVCHVAYTSGSTGQPKAVLFRHGALRGLIHTLREQCGITSHCRGTWLCSPGFGLVEVDCLPLLATGASVHIPPADIAADPERLRDWIVEQGISQSLWLTAIAERLWQLDWPADGPLRCVRVAGERVRSWPPATLPFSVLNVYGSAEATVAVTCELTALARAADRTGQHDLRLPIGRPVHNVRAYVLDADLRPVPPGMIGELYLSGSSLSLGYLNRGEVTAQKFLPNHVPGDPHPVLYRTGDLARRWEDGTLEVVGRTDDQVKVAGYRVQIGEVESALAAQPGVLRAAVTAREDDGGAIRLVGYVEPDRAAALVPRELRRALSGELPAYMLPAAFVVVPRMPISANGKIDKAALPDPPSTRPDLDVPYTAPGTGTEQILAGLWSEVLGIQDVGVLDSFFELGGDSLRAIRLIALVHARTGTRPGLSDLYDSPSPAALARVLTESSWEAPPDMDVPSLSADPAGRHDPFPLTDSQQALWIGRGDAVDYGNVGCHGYFEWENASLDVDRFRRAWNRLIERHPMLRMSVLPDGTQRVLERLPHDGVTLVDLRRLPPAEARREADRVREEMAHQVLPVERPPLYDVRLTLLPDGLVRIHFSLDMLVMDAWSIYQVLFPDLIDLYEHPGAALPDVRIDFRDYVLGRTAALADSAQRDASRDYWVSRLPALPPAPDLPLVARPEEPVRFDRREHAMPAPRWAMLKRKAVTRGITPSGILVAAFAEVLRAWSGNERFTINFPVSDRLPLHPQVDQLIGDFTNSLLVAIEKTNGTVQDRARDIQRQIWRDLEHRHFTGVEVMREIARRNAGALTPAMPIVVTSLLGHPARRQSSALGTETYGVSQTPQVLLDFQIREIDGILHLKWDHLAAMFPDGMIDDMFEAFRRLLDDLADGEGAWHSERPDLLPRRQAQQWREVNATQAPVRDVLLDELLAERAGAQPDAPAVISGRRTLTFGELHDAARRIGRALARGGARRDTLVAVVMDKGWEQYAGVYGVLASGAAYLPIDAALPQARIWDLITDGEVEVVLTQPWLAGGIAWPDGVRVIPVDDALTAFPEPEHDDGVPSEIARDRASTDLAYVIYTSGSTGRPKGVMVDHRAVVNHVTDITGRLGMGASDRMMATAALHFDMSVFDVFGILATGGATVLPDPYDLPDPAAWLRQAERDQVTFWAAVPQLMEITVEHAEAAGSRALRGLRNVVLAGDWIPLRLPDRVKALAPSVSVYGSGGPTETVNWSVLYPIGAVNPRWTSIPYGKPLANHRYYVLDERLVQRPVWARGQIVTASEVGLARGYWRDAERTAERFFRLPGSGERAYATGDMGRYLPDGNVEILGRCDFQVKIQGYRIELGEIEAAMVAHPAVDAAVVVAPDGSSGARRLVAFYTGGGECEQVQRHLGALLPAYMVPADLRRLPEIPLTGNGKVDRLGLLEAAAAAPERPTGSAATDAVALLLADLYAQALGLAEMDPAANFFAAGGDSLTGTRLINTVNAALGIEVPLRLVFTHPTPAGLCAALAADPAFATVITSLSEALESLDESGFAAA